jgi:hypothetical protein
LDGNYKINNIPKNKDRDNNTNYSKTSENEAGIDSDVDENGENSKKDGSTENSDPSLQSSIDDITAILNAKIKNSDISTRHKASIETQIEILANLIKSIPSKTNNKPLLHLIRTPK